MLDEGKIPIGTIAKKFLESVRTCRMQALESRKEQLASFKVFADTVSPGEVLLVTGEPWEALDVLAHYAWSSTISGSQTLFIGPDSSCHSMAANLLLEQLGITRLQIASAVQDDQTFKSFIGMCDQLSKIDLQIINANAFQRDSTLGNVQAMMDSLDKILPQYDLLIIAYLDNYSIDEDLENIVARESPELKPTLQIARELARKYDLVSIVSGYHDEISDIDHYDHTEEATIRSFADYFFDLGRPFR